MTPYRGPIGWRWLLAVLALACAGCATVPQSVLSPHKSDPWEEWNRRVFAFNEDLDEVILKPVATAYAEVVPPIVRQGVGNFYANIADAWSAVNNLLQGKPVEALQVAFRVGVNTLFGLGGVLDVASEMGVDRNYEDFGQTLGVWGMGTGAYLVWPVFGPSTERDSLALPLNYWASPMNLFNLDVWGQVGVWSLQLVNTRAGFLDSGRLLDAIVLDKYTFVRDGYLQRRLNAVFDGDVPPSADPSRDDGPGPDAASPPAAGASAAPSAAAASDAAK